jgi:hypothetical protein
MLDPEKHYRVSELLALVAQQWPHDRISLGDLMDTLGDRSFGVLQMVFALLFPIPGLASVMSVPIIFLAIQHMFGAQKPWLPLAFRNASLSTRQFRVVVDQSLPALKTIERYIHPRYGFITNDAAEKLLGFMVVLAAVVLAAPVPFGNFLPGMGIILISIAMIEKDGLCALIGIALTALGTLWVGIVSLAALQGVLILVHGLIT